MCSKGREGLSPDDVLGTGVGSGVYPRGARGCTFLRPVLLAKG